LNQTLRPILFEEEKMTGFPRALYLSAALSITAAQTATADDATMIKSAESAAPASVASVATIVAMTSDGKMQTLREGNSGWWCMPDNPATPGPDPMCGDANSMEWAMAWIGKTEPPKGKVGFMYMLAGGTDASNTDPYAKEPTGGNNWISTGPPVMVVNAVGMMAGYPTDPDPDTSRPYLMWAGTPYEHLMIPIK
jgi:hypothetical protein